MMPLTNLSQALDRAQNKNVSVAGENAVEYILNHAEVAVVFFQAEKAAKVRLAEFCEIDST